MMTIITVELSILKYDFLLLLCIWFNVLKLTFEKFEIKLQKFKQIHKLYRRLGASAY